jgi:lysozyme family protein
MAVLKFLHPRTLSSLNAYNQSAIIADVIGIEGGYVDNPADPGGATNWGITAATAAQYKSYLVSTYNWDGTMQNLTQQMATYVYIQQFWNPMSLDSILGLSTYTPLLADLLFEAGVNLGSPTVGKYLQQALNVLNDQGTYYSDITVDGNVGSMTVGAIQSLLSARPSDGLVNLLWMVSALVSARYIAIAAATESSEQFEAGWQNRARTQYNTYVLLMANGS